MSIGQRPLPAVRRGDVFWVDFDPPRGSEQGGRRPAVVVQTDDLNGASSTVVVAAITRTLPSSHLRPPQQVIVSPRETGLAHGGVVKCDQLLTVAVARLGDRIGRLAPALMAQVGESLSFVLDLEEQ